MKKKLIFAVTTCFFAVVTVFNMNIEMSRNTGDVTLESFAQMAHAQNSEHLNQSGTSLKWSHVAEWGYNIDRTFFGDHASRDFNNKVCDALHAVCDMLNLSGSAVLDDDTGRTLDRCDGQPHKC